MATRTVVCPNCDTPLAPGRFSCSSCGALVASVASASRPLLSAEVAAAPILEGVPSEVGSNGSSGHVGWHAADPVAESTNGTGRATDPDDAPLGAAAVDRSVEAEAVDTPADVGDGAGTDAADVAGSREPERVDPVVEAAPPPAVAQPLRRPPDVIPEWPAQPQWPAQLQWPAQPQWPVAATAAVAGAPAASAASSVASATAAAPPTVSGPTLPSPSGAGAARNPAGAYLPPSAVLPPAEALPLPNAKAGSASADRPTSAFGGIQLGLSPRAPAMTIAGGAGMAILGFLLPWADIVLGSASMGGYFDRWGLAGPGHPVVLALVIGLAGLGVAAERLPRWAGPRIPGLALAFLLLGLAWPYLFGPFNASLGIFFVSIGAAVIVVGGLLDLVASRHAEASASV
jgi:hypothetical protein